MELRKLDVQFEPDLDRMYYPELERALAEQEKEDPDVKLIWVLLPLGAAGLYFLSKKNGAGAAPGAYGVDQDIAPAPAGGHLHVSDPGADAGVAAGPPGDAPAAWSAQDLAGLANRISTDENYTRPELVHAIIAVESGWNPSAVNPADHAPIDQVDEGDSFGLMGLKVRTAQAFVPWVEHGAQLLDPVTNITAGIRFLKSLEAKWFNVYGLKGVIEMYNLGETRYRNGERSPDYRNRVQGKIASYNLTTASP